MPLIKYIKKLFHTFKYEELHSLHISDAIKIIKKEKPGLYIYVYEPGDPIPFGRMRDTIHLFIDSEYKVISYHYG